ncbi:uncharacterized protein LOC114518386 [Dendronephthya gigantea]|uniref:uncharacterized protein LOC114518386 n=1 Tax=Dendronephthya gigantea TaxID=151771 RepID=UPI001068F129|nr:uncharacterized protein LOC114518386 [Dendronephthya gigantea]
MCSQIFARWKKMRAPKIVHMSSVLFFVLCILQGVFLCIYPCKYLDYCWVFLFLVCFITASFMAIYLRFQKTIRDRFKWIQENGYQWDMKSALWCVWLVYSLGLMVTVAVIFNGVIKANHEQPCADANGNFSEIFKDVKFCRTKDKELLLKTGKICASNETSKMFCWKSRKIGLLPTDEFFGPNILKTTLCATPVLMLLLLKSARAPKRDNKTTQSQDQTGGNQNVEPEDPIEDEDLKVLYFRATLNLFDGIEMLEELLEHGTQGIDVPLRLETAILVCVCLFYFLSFLELLHLAFRCKDDEANGNSNTQNDDEERRKKMWGVTHVVNTVFQIGLNLSFFILRMIMWLSYKREAAIFIAKNLISIVMNIMPFFVAKGWVDVKDDDNDGDVKKVHA